jgi:GTP cyclohydrolase I
MNNVDVASCVTRELPGPQVGAFITASPVCWVVRPMPRTASYFIRSAMTGFIASVSTYRNRVSF